IMAASARHHFKRHFHVLLPRVGRSMRKSCLVYFLFEHAVKDGLEKSFRLTNGHAIFQTPEDLKPAPTTIVEGFVFLGHLLRHHDRHIDLRIEQALHAMETGWRHADDGEFVIVDEQLPADDGGISGKARSPVIVTQNGQRRSAAPAILGAREEAAQGRAQSQYRKVTSRYQLAACPLAAAGKTHAER